MKLEDLTSISPSLIQQLGEIGVASVESLVVKGFRDTKTLLPEVGDAELKKVFMEAWRKKGFWIMTAEEYTQLEKNRMFFSTGSKGLDQLIGGGIWTWNIAEFYGEQGIGKCLDPMSEVLTPYGWQTLSDIRIGDAVCCLNNDSLGFTRVVGKYISVQKRMLVVKTSSSLLMCSEDHKILTDKGWKATKHLRVGEQVCAVEGSRALEEVIPAFHYEEATGRSYDAMDEVAALQTNIRPILRKGTQDVLRAEKAEFKFETIEEIYPMDGEFTLQDITTVSGNYIANGIVVHNSQLLQTIAVVAAANNITTVFIDTEGTCRKVRMLEIAEKRGFDSTTVDEKTVFIQSVGTEILFEVVERLPLTIESKNVKVVCIDSLISPFRAEYLGREMLASRQQHLGKLLHRLKNMARVYNLAVAITNQLVAVPVQKFFGFDFKPTGGYILGHTSEPRVWIRRSEGTKRVARLVDSSWLPEGEVVFRISERGAEDV